MNASPSEFFKHRFARVTGLILALIILGLVLVWLRAVYGSVVAYNKGEDLLKEKEYIRAITYFDRSMHWYAPLNPYMEKSVRRLWEIGEQAENNGDIRLALIAFRTIRQGFYASRSIYTPGKDWIEKSNGEINRLLKTDEGPRGEKGVAEASAGFMKETQKMVGPGVLWSLVAVVGFFGWVGSAIGFIFFTMRPKEDKRYLGFPALIWIGLGFFFFAFWIIGMMKA